MNEYLVNGDRRFKINDAGPPNWHTPQGKPRNPHSIVAIFQIFQIFSPGLGQRPKKTAESLIQQGLRLCIAEQLFRPAKWAKFGQLAQAKEADI